MPRSLVPLSSLLLAAPLAAQTVALPTEFVTASRTPQPAEHVAVSAVTFYGNALRSAPTIGLDGALRSAPTFSLFRRSDSLIANPTAQGVSLRGLGPSGASRSLVVLDGVPLNDPFGGWVAWTKLPRESLARVEIVPGGGATAWGNAALGGVVQLFTETPLIRTLRAAVSAGDFGMRSGEFALTEPTSAGTLQLAGSDFSTDGFSLVAPERRGAIDIDAWSRHRVLTGRWRQPLGTTATLTATARTYEEFRGNGTPYTKNGSREKFASLAAAGSPAANFAWNAVAYAQDQSFASTFSSVNATRTAETPASDQFAVPATAFGYAWTGTWKQSDGARTTAGFDARYTHGETRENFTFTAGNFTRLRVAGGAQSAAGVFALHEQELAPHVDLSLGARLDSWHEDEGHRRETDRTLGTVFRNDIYAARANSDFSPSAGLVWTPDESWRLRANAQQSFRRPTLNELYRPFRQGANVTEANPDLRTERATSGEISVEWALKDPTPSPPPAGVNFCYFRGDPRLVFGVTAFANELRDAVGNVTIARGPGTFPIVGTLAAGGIGRQRLNVDRLRVQGLELTTAWRWTREFSLNAAILLNDATVRRATLAPALVGKRVAQVPRRNASLGATWRAPGGIVLTPRVRWIGRQFEDDENTLILGECVVADLGASRALTKHLELFLTCENVGNVRVETGRSADGIVNIGTPRLFLGGLRGSW